MKLLITTMIVSVLVLVGTGPSVGQADPGIMLDVAPKFVAGTIQAIDPAGLNIIVQTDQGKSEMLPVTSADAVKGFAKGDRVSVELDDKGTVIKIVKTATDQKHSPEPKS
ncbi:MAG TPA: hypothetical protein VES96_08505 [Nitrospiraceae bacterium]|nr:hypothetical protein [Nitrospiraceae bacterium]